MKHILIVDDSKENLVALKTELKKDYNVTPVTSGKNALKFLKTKETDLVLLDIDMPEMNGYEVLDEIKKNPLWQKIPIIFLTGLSAPEIEAECLARGADDFITKPYEPIVMRQRIQRVLELYALRYRLEENLQEKKNQIGKMTLGTIITIANTVDAKDKYTGGHSIRVAEGARAIARELAWSEEECQNIYNIAMLHDIGKIAIPDSVLNKAGRLNEQEEIVMRQHANIGYEILKEINILDHVEDGAHYHHERWDGNGYPAGLAGEEIPLVARIICISDSYDAMNSDRVYRKKFTHERIIERFKEGAGTQFDPKLAELFVKMLENGFRIDSKETALESMETVGGESLLLNKIVNEYTADLQVIAETDSLTGLFNRNYMKKKVDGMLIESENGVFFMIDVDNFKGVNDTHGHIVGDLILKMFSEVIKNEFRGADVLCRIGGDEFAVFLPGNPDRSIIEKKAQGIIDGVAARPEMAHYNIKSGVSIGIATCPEDGNDFESLYSCADKALYFVKGNGKNKYHFYGNDRMAKAKGKVNADM
ncbi:MAG: diguanylate cyclase, partial [Lachnospiraceae bacterium]|nr:diguanylate cyclase [Lachnospiraceae bacterium]